MTKAIIMTFLQEHKQEMSERFGLKRIGLFGSYAKDSATEESDIDLAIETITKDFFIREELRQYLESNFKRSVDIGYLDSFREFYRKKIEKEIVYV